jgi:predicted RNA-binding Zn-ribbon protein involved in translation (DUF1610 family)
MTDGPDERGGEPAAHGGPDVPGDGDGDLAARVAELERTVEALGETVERQRRDISYLAAAADIDSVEPVCPDCGEGALQRSSGLTWTQVNCPECGLKRYL